MKNKSFYSFRALIYISIILSVFTNCSTQSSTTNDKSLETPVLKDINNVIEDFPPPSDLIFSLENIHSEFNPNYINSIENVSKYSYSKEKMALNMGVYASDLMYLAAHDKYDESLKYIKICHDYALKLGHVDAYDSATLKEFKSHIESKNITEIIEYLRTLFIKTSYKIEENHRLAIVGISLMGNAIENFYFGAAMIDALPYTNDTNEKITPLVKVILNEYKLINDILVLAKELPYNEVMAELITEFSILKQIYDNDLIPIQEKLKKNPDYQIKKSEVAALVIDIKRIRDFVVSYKNKDIKN